MSAFKLGNITAVLGLGLLLGTATHFALQHQLESRAATSAAARSQQLSALRVENRQLVARLREEPAAGTPLSAAASDLAPRLRGAMELLRAGTFGPFVWTRGEGNSIAQELSVLAEVLQLSEAQESAMIAAAERARAEIQTAVLASARVIRNDNTVPSGVRETPEQQAERSRAMQTASPAEQRAYIADRLARESALHGERQLTIEFPESPEARAAYDRLNGVFSQILGPEKYGFYQTAGAARMLEGMFDEQGLQPHALHVVSRDAGSPSAADKERQSQAAQAREAAIASGRPVPPERTLNPGATAQEGKVYDLRRIRSIGAWSDPMLRSGERLTGGQRAFEPTPSTGVDFGGPNALSKEALNALLGPLQKLVPGDF